jgi:hypothetical protein
VLTAGRRTAHEQDVQVAVSVGVELVPGGRPAELQVLRLDALRLVALHRQRAEVEHRAELVSVVDVRVEVRRRGLLGRDADAALGEPRVVQELAALQHRVLVRGQQDEHVVGLGVHHGRHDVGRHAEAGGLVDDRLGQLVEERVLEPRLDYAQTQLRPGVRHCGRP